MRVAVRVLSSMLLFVAVAAAAASWFSTPEPLHADDAARVAVDALAAAGYGAAVVDVPTLGVHDAESGDAIDAWFVDLRVDTASDDERIELRIQESTGKLVYVDDRIGPSNTARLLSDDEFRALGAYHDRSGRDDWRRRNALATLSAVIVLGCAVVLLRRSDTLWSAS